MKAKITTNQGGGATLTLVPEGDDDRDVLKEFAIKTSRLHNFGCRGFEYMRAEVEFAVTQIRSSD